MSLGEWFGWDVVLTTAAVVAALGTVFGLLWKGSALIRRLEMALSKDSAGKTSIDRLDERASATETQLARIDYQLHPNGGGSMRDMVAKTENRVIALESQNKVVISLLNVLVGKKDV